MLDLNGIYLGTTVYVWCY